jgi:uncharacterized membrane protein YccF (DUF307 family)
MLGDVRVIGNVIWFVLAGLWLAIGYAVAGVIAFILIITIPFGVASFRLAGYALWPFGRSVVRKPTAGLLSAIGNVIWFFVAGLWLALLHVVAGVLLCLTIIGIPFGVASFKMAGLALFPLGKTIVDTSGLAAASGQPAVVSMPTTPRG